ETNAADGTDCDDLNSSVYPSATEICNGLDENCNDVVDDNAIGQVVHYQDIDGDGYGDAQVPLTSCETYVQGHVLNALDCNDTAADQNPLGIETCNELDDNCNGVVDDNATDMTIWYLDSDEDGYGDVSSWVLNCTAPELHVPLAGDCDDQDSETSPDTPEECNDLDDNCNGQIDEGFDAIDWYYDADEDGFGDPWAVVSSCEEMVGMVQDNTDCDDSDSEHNPNTPEECNGIDDNCNGQLDEGFAELDWYYDSDEDGFGDPSMVVSSCQQMVGMVQDNTDCNDSDSEHNPDTPEECNGTDDNCNGEIDEDFAESDWYYDADEDGFGDPSMVVSSCQQMVGMVQDNTDCDDSDSEHNPDTPEECNGIDDNCNGQLDEGFAELDWYYDSDEDGFGDPSMVLSSCQQMVGMVQDNTDCNDSDTEHNPDTPEECNGIDDNCNGEIDEGFAESDWYYDSDEDGFGDPSMVLSSCQQMVGMVQDNTDCDDSDSEHNPNTPEECNGLDDNCNGQLDEGFAELDWYYDEDEDGFGAPWVVVSSCQQMVGMVQDNTDCDDDNADINPDEDEWCNDNIDNNCDGYLDDETSIDAFSGYLDYDDDGYGGGALESSCEDIYFADNEDCDDENAAVNPSATEECDGIDNNCNGDIDTNALCKAEISACRLRRLDGSSYLFCRQNQTWSVAKGECASLGYYLASVDDATEDEWIDDKIDGFNESAQWWIGYNDLTVEGYWDWDGPYSTYTNWAAGEPNNANSNEDCALLNTSSDGTWSDADCQTSTFFVCEANP
ncbi:MAG: hypothetical protein CMK59_12910, partial [Proteobacteria bacterium]|nr:hypothetical protein [Pseudomonadota bacterium]